MPETKMLRVRVKEGFSLTTYAQNMNSEVFTQDWREVPEDRIEVNSWAQPFLEIEPVKPDKKKES